MQKELLHQYFQMMLRISFGRTVLKCGQLCGGPQNEQGILVLLQSLMGNKKAKKNVSPLATADLHKKTGLKILIRKLDNAFQDEEAENANSTYKKFAYLKTY